MPIGKNNLFIRIFPSFLPFFYSIWLEMIFFKECLIKTVDFVYNALISLVNKSKGLVSSYYHKYSGFIAWCSYIKETLIAKPILLIPTGIAGYYVYSLYTLSLASWLMAGVCYCQSQVFSLLRPYGTSYRRNCHRQSYFWTIFGSPFPSFGLCWLVACSLACSPYRNYSH